MTKNTLLPYTFDLFWDIKTKDRLDQELNWAIEKVGNMVEAMENHKIEMTPATIEKLKELKVILENK